jgi:hypothetical protein
MLNAASQVLTVRVIILYDMTNYQARRLGLNNSSYVVKTELIIVLLFI